MSWKTLVTLCITKSKICFTLEVSIHETYSWDKYFLPILNYCHWYYELPLNKIKTEIKKASLKNLRPNQVEKHGKYKSIPRDGSRTAAASKMELFVIIVNGFQPLTIITKCSILDIAAVLDPPLFIIIIEVLEVYLDTKIKIISHAIPKTLQTFYFGKFGHD